VAWFGRRGLGSPLCRASSASCSSPWNQARNRSRSVMRSACLTSGRWSTRSRWHDLVRKIIAPGVVVIQSRRDRTLVVALLTRRELRDAERSAAAASDSSPPGRSTARSAASPPPRAPEHAPSRLGGVGWCRWEARRVGRARFVDEIPRRAHLIHALVDEKARYVHHLIARAHARGRWVPRDVHHPGN